MRRQHPGLVLGLLMWAVSLVPLSGTIWPRAAAQPAPGRILAPVGRQLGWLNLDAPRPQLLTHFDPPAYVTAVAATPTAPLSAVAVSRPFGDSPGGALGGDLLAVDPTSGQVSTLVGRSDANESLAAPAWWFDGSGLLFERQDMSVAGIGYPGSSTVLYPTRIEMVQPDGSGRSVVVPSGRQPAPAPDGSGFAFLRTSSAGTALMLWSVPDGSERVLVDAGPFPDLASPRYSPQGDRLAFMAPGTVIGDHLPGLLASSLFGAGIASAHGLPWDVWLMRADGSDMHLLAQLGADDGTLAWSPDGTQLFIYSGTGSFLVDPVTGDTTPVSYLAGYGTPAWLPS